MLSVMREVVILGSTGSIGVQALEIVAASGELEVVGLAAGSSWERVLAQAEEHGVGTVAFFDPDAAAAASGAWDGGKVLSGEEGIRELIASSGADLVLNGIVGAAGLGPTIVALGEGIDVALANKESLVIGGELTMALAEATGARLLPVDSEHSALFQLIGAEPPGTVDRLVLTASGGPFRGRTDLDGVTVDEALAHPTWSMGGRITVDSATLMNKGFEAIEAHHLFGVPFERIEVVVHPQSIVHSLIDLNDGATLAHLGHPDMRVPISYALHYPERADVDVPRLEPRRGGCAHLRAARPGDLRLSAPRPRGRQGGGDRALCPQRRRRGGGRRLPRRQDWLHRDPGRDRARLGSDAGDAADPLRRPLRRRRRGPAPHRRGGRRVGTGMSWLLVFLGFSLLIILHEGGHFFAAKATGMRVEKFFLFLGPKVVSFKRGETEYGIAAIPLGGFVKITGMNPEEEVPREVEARAYSRQPVWKRIVVVAAGPAVNIVLAFAILFVLAFGASNVTSKVGEIVPGSPAASVLKPGDRVLAIDGKSYPNLDSTARLERFTNDVAAHKCPGKQADGCRAATPVTLTVKRNGGVRTISVLPEYDASVGHTRIGFAYGEVPANLGFGGAVSFASSDVWQVTSGTFKVFSHIFESKQRKQVSGVVGVSDVAHEVIGFGVRPALGLLALVSLSLGLINLLPILPLDGGHIFWSVVEKLRGEPVSLRVIERATVVGFALVAVLMVIGFSNDLGRITGEGFHVR